MQALPSSTTVIEPKTFPFELKDLKYWVVKKTDGTMVKYELVDSRAVGPKVVYPAGITPATQNLVRPVQSNTNGYVSVSRWCNHTPTGHAILHEGEVNLWVADAPGLRQTKQKFDFILDCGNILRPGDVLHALEGDKSLVDDLSVYSKFHEPRYLWVDWEDRKDPPLEFEFWRHFAEIIKGQVVVACQGGHGRSGSSAVALMMALIPDYTPFTAICHLRALHCPRAIESKVQHEYLGQLGAYLGREDDIKKAEGVKDFKKTFLSLDVKGAKKYQEWLESGKVAATLNEREEDKWAEWMLE